MVRSWILVLALTGCGLSTRDHDGDGVSPQDGDCDDDNATTHPNASETCDGADNDCDGSIDEDAADAAMWYADADADGFPGDDVSVRACQPPDDTWGDTPTDCDDLSAASAPGAQEVCDGADNDCDGLIDDNDDSVDTKTHSAWLLDADGDGYGQDSAVTWQCSPPDGHVASGGDCDDTDPDLFPGLHWHPDADLDGFGDRTQVFVSCAPPGGHIADGEDCDDTDPAIRPGAAEVCDGVDNDCDDLTDDDDVGVDSQTYSVWFLDGDGDGYGDAVRFVSQCQPPSGYVGLNGDCDDTSSDISPGADEVCDNGIDDDCDGSAWPCGFTGDRAPSDASASITSSGGNLGYDIAIGDLDGDGGDDAVIPAYADTGGVIYVALGPITTSTALSGVGGADLIFEGDDAFDYAGKTVDAGDLDGDGVDDLLIGAYGNDEAGNRAGAAFVVYGSASLTGGEALSARAEHTWYGEAAGDLLGTVTRFVGDLDGDGTEDIAIGAPGTNDGSGSVFLVYGASTVSVAELEEDADAILTTGDEDEQVGTYRSLARGGDADGDGLGELLVLASDSDRAADGAGVAWVLYGSASALRGDVDLDDADAILLGTDAHDALGAAACAGDLDSDGYSEIIVSAYSADSANKNEGAIYVYRGSTSRLSSAEDAEDIADSIIWGAAGADYAGAGLAAGDLNQDGQDDLLIGATGVDTTAHSSAGAAYVLYGPLSGTLSVSDADASLTGASSYAFTGQSLLAGDINHDGQNDAAISGYGDDRVDLFFGGGL